jgi:hypothetical protein
MDYRTLSLALVCLLTAVPAASAQVTTLDEGSFTLFVGAERVGREEFSIRRVPDGGRFVLLSQATIAWDDRRLAPALRTDSLGVPLSYQMEVRTEGRVGTRVSATAAGSRLALRVTTDRGESARQLPVADRTVILDDEVVHHHYFVVRQGAGTMSVIVPRRLGREDVVVTVRPSTAIEIGTGTVPARHFLVTDPAGVVTDVWVDADGRLLRLAVPARGFVAIRDEPPR